MIKFLLLALAMLSATQAASPQHVHKALLRNVDQLRGSLSLFENSGSDSSQSSEENNEETCAIFENGLSLDQCKLMVAEDDELTEDACPCIVKLLPSMKPLMDLTDCAGENPECEDMMQSLTWEMCDANSCINRFVSALRGMLRQAQDPICRGVPTFLNQTDVDNFEDLMDFTCSKNTQGAYCGQAWTDVVERTIANDNCKTPQCACSEFAGLGCCSRTFYDYYNEHQPHTADAIVDVFNNTCSFDLPSMPSCPDSKKKSMTYSKSKLKFNSVQCGMTKKVAAYKVQQMIANKTQANIGDVSVTVTDCSCCAATSRRLLSTGSMTAEVAILGNNAESAGAELTAALAANTLGSDELGSVDASQSEQPRMVTQESDIGNSASLAAVPSLLLLVLAVIVLL